MVLLASSLAPKVAWQGLDEQLAWQGADSRLLRCDKNLQNISIAIDMYASDHGENPRSLSVLVPTYLEAIPTCPSGSGDTYSSRYRSWPNLPYPSEYKNEHYVSCHGHHHRDAGARPEHPWGPRVCLIGNSDEEIAASEADHLR